MWLSSDSTCSSGRLERDRAPYNLRQSKALALLDSFPIRQKHKPRQICTSEKSFSKYLEVVNSEIISNISKCAAMLSNESLLSELKDEVSSCSAAALGSALNRFAALSS